MSKELQNALAVLEKYGMQVVPIEGPGHKRSNYKSAYDQITGGICDLPTALRSFRTHKGWSQQEVFERCHDYGWTGISQTVVSTLELGKRPFESKTKACDGEVKSIAGALDDVFGKEWRKESVKVRKHNRVGFR